MEQPIKTANYLREVERLNIKIYDLDNNDKLLWDEVEELLKDNNLWDGYNYDDDGRYYRYAKRIYAVTTKMFDFKYIENAVCNKLWSHELRLVINSPEESLYRYMYEPEYCDNYYGYEQYCIQLPIDYDYCHYNYIVILLKNDNVILGRYGVKEFGYEINKCYYYDDIKQVSFDKLEEPFKSLIVEKLIEEEKQGYIIMENLLHLIPNTFEPYDIDVYIVPDEYATYLTKEENNLVLDIDPQEYDEMMRTNEDKNTYKELQTIKAKEEQKYGPIIEYKDFVIKEDKSKNLLQENILREEKKVIL